MIKKRSYRHIKGITVKAVFKTENEMLMRYKMEIVSEQAENPFKTVCVVMQNPSYADENDADKSVQFLEKVVFQTGTKYPEFNGVGRLIIVNQFARVQTKNFRGSHDAKGMENDSVIKIAFQDSDIILIAWGVGNTYEDRKRQILMKLEAMPEKKIFVTSSHPSRGKYEGFIKPFVPK